MWQVMASNMAREGCQVSLKKLGYVRCETRDRGTGDRGTGGQGMGGQGRETGDRGYLMTDLDSGFKVGSARPPWGPSTTP